MKDSKHTHHNTHTHTHSEDSDDVATSAEVLSADLLTEDEMTYSYTLTGLSSGNFELTVTPISVVGDNTVAGMESVRRRVIVGE